MTRMTDSLVPGERIQIVITLHTNGALSVEGPVHDKRFCLAMLDNAIQAVKGYGQRPELVVPEHDVEVPTLRERLVTP